MNIIFLSVNLAKGGAENQLVKLAAYFKNKNYNVQIISLGQENDFVEFLNENNLEVVLLPFKYGFGLYKILNEIVKFKTDVTFSIFFGRWEKL